jgi:hypothetical protein
MVYAEDMKNEKMTTKQAMNFLGIKSKITMRKHAESGAIPWHWEEAASGKWRIFMRNDLVAFKAKMTKDPSRGFSYVPVGFVRKKPTSRL